MLFTPQSIQVQGTQQYTPDQIAQAADVKLGHTYSADALSQTAQKLMATGLFDKVGFKFDGRALVYLVTDSPDLYPVTTDNLPLPPDIDVDSELRAEVPLFHGKVPSEGTVFDDVHHALQAMLAQAGVQATVVSVPGGNDLGKKATTLAFRIGSIPVRIGAIQLTGIPPEVQANLPKALSLAKADYSADRSAAEIRHFYESALANLGYAGATVRVRNTGIPQQGAEAISVPFIANIALGRRYKLGEVQVAADVPVTMSQLELTTNPRSTYSPENSYLGAVVAALTFHLKSMGYLNCEVDAHPQMDESSGTVSYTLGAKTGPVYHLAFVKFENVSDQLRILLMRNWQMIPGDPFDETYVSRFILNAEKSDPVLMRSLAGVKATDDVKADPQTHDVNLIVRVEK